MSAATNRSIDVGIVNYNGGEVLLPCVESLRTQSNVEIRIFVYDNCSSDASIETIAHFDNITIVRGAENAGYAYACNRLIELMDAPIVCVANMDLIFPENWASTMLNGFADYPDAFSVAPLVLERTSPPPINFAGMSFFDDLHPQSTLAGFPLDAAPTRPCPIFGAYGAVMAFRRELFAAIGLFDEDYFLFYEETEFFWRMNLYGFETIFYPAAVVHHWRSHATKRFSRTKLFWPERNRVYTGLKILPVYRYPQLFLVALHRFARMRKSLAQQRTADETSGNVKGLKPAQIIGIILHAWLSALLCFPRILAKRHALFSRSGAAPRDTLAILERYRADWSTLSIK